jgi:hypothetical protein
MMMRRIGLLAAVLALAGALAVAAAPSRAPAAVAQTITLAPLKDNTLYESATGALSNGAGQYLFAGQTANDLTRRAALAFDLSGLPAGATVTAATLTLSMSKTISGQTPMTLHALQKAWGEGASDALGEEGAGAAALTGDATWLHTHFDDALWAAPGGDFAATALATTMVGGTGSYSWSSAALVADVQRQLDNPAAAFGWLLRGDESGSGTAKRFDSRQHPTPANRPRLTVTYVADARSLFAPIILSDK